MNLTQEEHLYLTHADIPKERTARQHNKHIKSTTQQPSIAIQQQVKHHPYDWKQMILKVAP